MLWFHLLWGNWVIGETFFLLGVRRQVEELRDELIRMKCFLRDADERNNKEMNVFGIG